MQDDVESTFITIGSIGDQAGTGGSLRPVSTANFKNRGKLVCMKVKTSKGQSTLINCVSSLSTKLRNGELEVDDIHGYPVIYSEDSYHELTHKNGDVIIDEATGAPVMDYVYYIGEAGRTEIEESIVTKKSKKATKEETKKMSFAQLVEASI